MTLNPFHLSQSRRGFVGLSAAAFGSIALASCGGSSAEDEPIDVDAQNVGAMEDFAADTQFTATEPIEVGILWTDWPEVPVEDTWKIFDHIKELTNVELKLTHIPFSDHEEKRSLLISAGDAPTLIPLVYTGEDSPYVSSGAVVPMSDYVEHMPNFQKYVKEWELGQMIENIKQADGKYYMLPGLQEVSVPVFSLVVRKDVFEDVVGSVPGTWEELREGLRAVKEAYPDSVPLADGFEAQSMLNYAAHAFGTIAGWGFGGGFIDAEGDELVYAAATDEYKSLVEYFHSLVEEGLIDRESLTASNDGSGAADVGEKFANELCFAASGSSGTAIEFAQALNETVGEGNYEVSLIPPPAGPAGDHVEPRNFWHGFMLNSEITRSENFLATLQFTDWLYFNPAAREMLRWGIEGETYTKAEDGTIELKDGFAMESYNINSGAEVDINADLGFATFPAESTESRSLKESYSTPEFVQYIEDVLSTRDPRDPIPPVPLEEAELEKASLMSTPLKDTVDTATLQFIMGERDLDEWDDFVAELEAAGMSRYMELINTARSRFAEANG
ncbi:extracellular solute-binding protein [Brachybacterium fresconis]|uniref:Multiple sugar transport system substrate-binding protein/putative aldouronate transport system substrate-binding protein n=1 Tax=Brachybacterium fresconis TaxID=173363 RepID=A0ABS4YM25_9MICO|nr:extracellular solute-binding protein [Brachybacterium fresconis]MBP2409799.1 multiple sugar transport system substrate-binding protein/putative aldouronate transport system substrate-binding protein [Brachybacterium fresconis]